MLVRVKVLQYEKLLVSVEQLFSAKLPPSVDCNCDEALKFPSEKELNAPKGKKKIVKKKHHPRILKVSRDVKMGPPVPD